MTTCPCGSGNDLEECCLPIIAAQSAPTAEALLRSRYTAFVLGKIGYLSDTLTAESKLDFDPVEAESIHKEAKWKGLEIRKINGGGEGDDKGSIEFVARMKLHGQDRMLHELSQFERVDGRWLCADGISDPKEPQRRVTKVGRNEPCPCGSGKKYKKCCGA